MDSNYVSTLGMAGRPIRAASAGGGRKPAAIFAETWDGGRCSPGACAHRDAATRGSQPVLGSGLGRWYFAVKPPLAQRGALAARAAARAGHGTHRSGVDSA